MSLDYGYELVNMPVSFFITIGRDFLNILWGSYTTRIYKKEKIKKK